LKIYDPFRKRWFEEEIKLPINVRAEALIATFPFVDLHTHVRLNGGEDYFSLSRAAIAGGFLRLVIQPNTSPPLDDVEVLQEHERLVRGKNVRYHWAVSLFGNLEPDGKKVVAYSTDGFRYDHVSLDDALSRKRKKAVIFDHSQVHELKGIFYRGASLPGASRPISNEAIAMVRTVLTGVENGFKRFHIQHLSTKLAVGTLDYLRKYAYVTCEVTPHHLFFSWQDVKNADFKVNPPLGSEEDRRALISAVKDGTINVLATDHAPHPEKPPDFMEAPFGTSNIEVAFSVFYTVLEDLELVVDKLTVEPLKILNLQEKFTGQDLVVIDPEMEWIVDAGSLFTKGKNCVFNGVKLKGKVLGVRKSEKWIYWDGEFLESGVPA